MNNSNYCGTRINQSDPFHIGDKYGGIPLNLCTNLLGSSVLIILFLLIRKNALKSVRASLTRDALYNVNITLLLFGKQRVLRGLAKEEEEAPAGSESLGEDVVQYLTFQKYIILYVFFTTVVSIGLVLPLNFQGSQLGNGTQFGHTTLANLSPNQPEDQIYLWVHVIVAFIMFPIAIFLMRVFSTNLKMTDTDLKITRTLAIENIPLKHCEVSVLRDYFLDCYPHLQVTDIQLAFDVSRLISLTKKLTNTNISKEYSLRHEAERGQSLKLYPVRGMRLCLCCWPCFSSRSAAEVLTLQQQRLTQEVRAEEKVVRSKLIGLAFVTFRSINGARHVHADHHRSSWCFWRRSLPVSSKPLDTQDWSVWYAPPPSDIIWENLPHRQWTNFKKILANLFIFLVGFFLTTPQFVVHLLDPILTAIKGTTTAAPHQHNSVMDNVRDVPSWLTDFLPTLMLWSFTALLPVVVGWADLLVGHETRSGENHAIMKKTFWYLLFMVIILPTFGYTTSHAYFDNLLRNNSLNWDCIFLPDSGAFFVNYVITSALIGSSLELVRFPELFWYLLQLGASRSKAEDPAIQRDIRLEFRFGEHYARMLLIFAMVVMFSISCPLITPFGCLYFIFKHFVDKHNLEFAYNRSKINKKVHATAIHFVIMSVALLQLMMIVFSLIRSLDPDSPSLTLRTKVSIGLFVLTLNVCSAHIWSNTCRRISPIKYKDVLLADDPEDGHDEIYLPDVLKERDTDNRRDSSYQTFQ